MESLGCVGVRILAPCFGEIVRGHLQCSNSEVNMSEEEKRDHRIQIMLTEKEFNALAENLSRYKSLALMKDETLSDFCHHKMINEGWFRGSIPF